MSKESARGRGIGGHTLPNKGQTNDWITPKSLLQKLDKFDLDPCQSLTQPWPCAARGYTINDNGLALPWSGRVFCNPPYGDECWPFLEKLAIHGNGIALVFARTETKFFQLHVWDKADAILFIDGRLTFYMPDGTKGKGNSGGPSVLIAYGKENVEFLRKSKVAGALVADWENSRQKTPALF